MGVLRIRSSARILNPAPAGFRILAALDDLAASFRRDIEITSGDEGEDWRVPTDPHQTREAYDVSVKTWTEAEVVLAWRSLRQKLGDRFTVLYEVPAAVLPKLSVLLQGIAYANPKATGVHFHIQRKRGTTYP